MKKSVIVIIGVIYIMAIAVVSFFGLKIETFNQTTYVERVECINEELKVAVDGTKYIVVHYQDGVDTPTVVQLQWRVYPDEASRKNVSFAYDETSTVATVNAFGAVVFNKKGTITIQILAMDGSSKSETVKVIAK